MSGLDERRQMEQDISNQADNISHTAARNLIREFGDIETLEQAYLDEVLEVSGVGPKTAEKLGVWDEDGNPVGSLTRFACPVCHEEYEDWRRVGDDTECSLDSTNVCIQTPGGVSSLVVLYEH